MAGEELDLTERLNNNNINCYMGRGGDTNDIQQIRMDSQNELICEYLNGKAKQLNRKRAKTIDMKVTKKQI